MAQVRRLLAGRKTLVELLLRKLRLSLRHAKALRIDLLTEAARRHRAGLSFATVVFARQTSVGIGRCVEDLEVIAKSLTPVEARDQVTYLPL